MAIKKGRQPPFAFVNLTPQTADLRPFFIPSTVTIRKQAYPSWQGFAFERFCLKHSGIIAGIMGFADEVVYAVPYFEKGATRFQIDLLFHRADKVLTICEVKHHNNKIGSWIIPEMERRCSLFKIPRGSTLEKALISLYGPDDSLINSDYFHHSITMDDIFNFSS